MKKITRLFIFFIFIFGPDIVYAECVINTTVYTACKPGYYLKSNDCIRCPVGAKDANGNDVYGTSADRNANGIGACYLPVGPYKDIKGIYIITSDCAYKN